MAKFRLSAQTNKLGSQCSLTFEIDDEDLDGLSEYASSQYIDETAQEQLWQLVEWGWEEI